MKAQSNILDFIIFNVLALSRKLYEFDRISKIEVNDTYRKGKSSKVGYMTRLTGA